MQAFQISDSSGVWALNIGAYRLPDPESGTNFEPGIPTQARLTAWMMGQPTLVPCEDPREPVRPVEQEESKEVAKAAEEVEPPVEQPPVEQPPVEQPPVEQPAAPAAPAPAHKGKHK